MSTFSWCSRAWNGKWKQMTHNQVPVLYIVFADFFYFLFLKATLPPLHTRGSVSRFSALEVLAAESCVTFPLQGMSSSACTAKALLGTGQREVRRPQENKQTTTKKSVLWKVFLNKWTKDSDLLQGGLWNQMPDGIKVLSLKNSILFSVRMLYKLLWHVGNTGGRVEEQVPHLNPVWQFQFDIAVFTFYSKTLKWINSSHSWLCSSLEVDALWWQKSCLVSTQYLQ